MFSPNRKNESYFINFKLIFKLEMHITLICMFKGHVVLWFERLLHFFNIGIRIRSVTFNSQFQREQLERARQEQVKAAAKMKLVAQKESEKEQEASSEKEKEDDKLGKSTGNAGVGGKVEGPAVPASVWLCLRCGSQACGSTTSGHSLGHYNTPR